MLIYVFPFLSLEALFLKNKIGVALSFSTKSSDFKEKISLTPYAEEKTKVDNP